MRIATVVALIVVALTGCDGGGTHSYAFHHGGKVNPAGGTPTNCFGHEESCGYPGPEDTGVEKGVTLTKHAGNLLVTKEGETVENLLIEGAFEIKANNVHAKNIEVVTYSQIWACNVENKKGEPGGSGAVQVQSHSGEPSTGVVVEHITVHGVTQGCGTEGKSLGEGIRVGDGGSAENARIEYAKVYWIGKCGFGAATWKHDYCDVNAELPSNGGSGEAAYLGAHYDGIFSDGSGTTTGTPGLWIENDTILMPHWQTSPLDLSNEKEVGEEIIARNLLAGGEALIFAPGSHGETPTVKGPVYFRENRLARCLGKEKAAKGNHKICEGLEEENEVTGKVLPSDSFGFFPKGGSEEPLFEASPYVKLSQVHFEGNFWDDNLESVL